MSSTYRIFFFLLLFCCCSGAIAQEIPQDSVPIYRKIETYSQKRKFTKFLHGLIFEPVTPKTLKARKRDQRKRFRAYQGKIIRHINITTLDPFGYSESDTVSKPRQRASKIGNALHLKSKDLTIWNLLLIKKNKPFDSLLVKESERLIRSQRYVRRVLITPVKVSKDSVDIDIRVLDSWSLIPDFSTSASRTTYGLTERNFLGFGHQVETRYMKKLGTDDDAFSSRYTIPNIMNTYIRTTLTYQKDLDNNYVKSLNIERPFFSPFARWAGGLHVGQEFRHDTLPEADYNYSRQNFKHNVFDMWGGHSYQVFKGDSEDDRTTNLITTARYYQLRFIESPTIAYDSVDFYSNERSWLFGIGIASRQYIEDRYLFNYGIIEDVPIGKSAGITLGFQEKNNIRRPYLGARLILGKYYDWGYLSSNFEYGTYLNNGTTHQSAFSFQSNYFTHLIETGKWKFRQFFKAGVIIGANRQASQGDQLTLNDNTGLEGFRSALYGTKKIVLSLQTQSYAPWDAWGFRLNPYFNYSVGMLGNSGTGFSKSKPYSKISIGLLISNDYLVFSTFQLSISYFPVIPNEGENLFKTNAYNTEDFGFQDFELAKPRTVLYE
ncbi:MAG TPA: hypothetical protein VF676_10550 [Flavobacterium sp.]|jgi:hypothetical protein